MRAIEFHDLGQVGILRISGAGAGVFLQGQLTVDVRTLTPGSGQLAAWCSPQGRVIALLRLAPIPDGFLALLPGSLAGAVADGLRRFLLRAKATITDVSGDLRVLALSTQAPGPVEPGWTLDPASQLVHLTAARALLVGSEEAIATARNRATPAPDGAWEALAVRLGEPEVYPATSEDWVPQMLNLDLLGAVSFRKGCYSGQEIVARTQNLGRIKRRLFRYHLAGTDQPAAGSGLLQGETKVGEVVRVARCAGRTELLGVVNLDASGARLVAEQVRATCTPEPLPYDVPEAAGTA